MTKPFPYQVVAFLDKEPAIGESAYNSPRGWFPQIALKRRFTLERKSEQDIVKALQRFAQTQRPFEIQVGNLTKPQRMPVHILEVDRNSHIDEFHNNLIEALGKNLMSRYPERDGENYLPHITVEYDGKFVVDSDKYKNRKYTLAKICLLRDDEINDSFAFKYFRLGHYL